MKASKKSLKRRVARLEKEVKRQSRVIDGIQKNVALGADTFDAINKVLQAMNQR